MLDDCYTSCCHTTDSSVRRLIQALLAVTSRILRSNQATEGQGARDLGIQCDYVVSLAHSDIEHTVHVSRSVIHLDTTVTGSRGHCGTGLAVTTSLQGRHDCDDVTTALSLMS